MALTRAQVAYETVILSRVPPTCWQRAVCTKLAWRWGSNDSVHGTDRAEVVGILTDVFLHRSTNCPVRCEPNESPEAHESHRGRSPRTPCHGTALHRTMKSSPGHCRKASSNCEHERTDVTIRISLLSVATDGKYHGPLRVVVPVFRRCWIIFGSWVVGDVDRLALSTLSPTVSDGRVLAQRDDGARLLFSDWVLLGGSVLCRIRAVRT